MELLKEVKEQAIDYLKDNQDIELMGAPYIMIFLILLISAIQKEMLKII